MSHKLINITISSSGVCVHSAESADISVTVMTFTLARFPLLKFRSASGVKVAGIKVMGITTNEDVQPILATHNLNEQKLINILTKSALYANTMSATDRGISMSFSNDAELTSCSEKLNDMIIATTIRLN